jgi:hypothetical protein
MRRNNVSTELVEPDYKEINVCKNCLNGKVRELYAENLSLWEKLEDIMKGIKEMNIDAFKRHFWSPMNNYMYEETMACMKKIDALIDNNGSVDEIRKIIVYLEDLDNQ